MKRIVTAIISFIILSACQDSAPSYDERPHGIISIAHLKATATTEIYTITDDIAIEGYVVANDLFGEFYKSIVICDDSGGIEIAVDTRNTAVQFPISARVVVYCSGLTIGEYGGELTLGAIPAGSYTVDRIAEKDFLRYFLIDKESPKAIKPTVTAISEITPAHIGNYIRLNNVTFAEQAGNTWCDIDSTTGEYTTTERSVYDQTGREFTVRTIAECSYRNEKIPAGYGDLCGVVTYFNGNYSLRIVNHQILFD